MLLEQIQAVISKGLQLAVSNNQTGELMNLDQLVTHRVLRDPVQLAVLVSPVTAYILGVYRVSRPAVFLRGRWCVRRRSRA
jgi:hypothetical protein